VETCCQALLYNKEYPTDEELVATVRLQCLIESMNDHLHRPISDAYQAPTGMQIKLFRSQIDALKVESAHLIPNSSTFSNVDYISRLISIH
jgi:hypothetical protein